MKREEMVLRAAKEVAVKYIETGRLPLSNFEEAFALIHRSVDSVVPRQDGQED